MPMPPDMRLHELSTEELLRSVDRSNPEVRELAYRLELMMISLYKDKPYSPTQVVEKLRSVAGI